MAVDTDMISVLRAERAGFALREVKIGHFDILFLGEIEHFLFVCESGIRNFQRSSVLSFRFYETAIADIRLRQPTVQAAGEALLLFCVSCLYILGKVFDLVPLGVCDDVAASEQRGFCGLFLLHFIFFRPEQV